MPSRAAALLRPLALAAACLLAGCAGPRTPGTGPVDPLEPVNRLVFSANEAVDFLLLDPAVTFYTAVVPEVARDRMSGVLANLRAPVTFVNDLLQGERERAGITLGRFMVNTTFGLGGMFDMASAFGLPPPHVEDFGQTLAVWGVGEGPYLVLPLLGPSTLRDAAGLAVDGLLLDPVVHLAPPRLRLARSAADGFDRRVAVDPVLDDVRRNSLDPYATLRSAYVQRRASEIANGRLALPPPSVYEPLEDPEER